MEEFFNNKHPISAQVIAGIGSFAFTSFASYVLREYLQSLSTWIRTHFIIIIIAIVCLIIIGALLRRKQKWIRMANIIIICALISVTVVAFVVNGEEQLESPTRSEPKPLFLEKEDYALLSRIAHYSRLTKRPVDEIADMMDLDLDCRTDRLPKGLIRYILRKVSERASISTAVLGWQYPIRLA